MRAVRRFALLSSFAALSVLVVPLVAKAITVNFNFTFIAGCPLQPFVVPTGVTAVTVDVFGAQGGGVVGGTGGQTTATIPVSPLETLRVTVGGAGGVPDGGCNGGGAGGPGANGGGGASDLRQGGVTLADRAVIAGGGGGAAGPGVIVIGGAGGGLSGHNGVFFGGGGGFGAVLFFGGTGGDAGTGGTAGIDGTLGTGGAGGGPTGGGGGGLAGGGGGGGHATIPGGGGGGGSAFALPTATGVTFASGVQFGDGSVTITYTVVTAVTLRSFVATRVAQGVRLAWRTASEVDTLGFNVYRQVNSRRVRVNARLIVAKGRGSYSLLDRRTQSAKKVRYWLQAVDLDGSQRWYGPARISNSSS